MRSIPSRKITDAVSRLCMQANFELRRDVLRALRRAQAAEKNSRARRMLEAIVTNAAVARRERLAICQDTGLPVVFVELGQDARVAGDLKKAIVKGVEEGYRKGCLRDSIVGDPLKRGRPGFTPPVLHIDIVPGNKITLAVLPKGFGCENKTQLAMFNPTASWRRIKDFIVGAVKAAGPDACPPYVVGVGLGGTAEYACLLAKKALLRKIARPRLQGAGSTRRLEKELLAAINKLGIGPMGLGGATTALAVSIGTYPTHIAGLPVAVSISCHALRSAKATL
ncbi:MAG: fumarate hydratase [Candidatus Omnitrophica bacterium]|nr:fumarate hydratase [Candidatus Omnitrophota bacterium]